LATNHKERYCHCGGKKNYLLDGEFALLGLLEVGVTQRDSLRKDVGGKIFEVFLR